MKKLGAITLLVCFMVALLSFMQVSAQTKPTWFDGVDVIKIESLDNDPLGKIDTYNAPCYDETFSYYHFGQWNLETEGERTECVHHASYGDISLLGGLKLKNASKAYKLYTGKSSYNPRIFPIVNSDHAFTLTGNPGISREYVYIYKNLSKNISVHKQEGSNKPLFLKLDQSIAVPANKVVFANGEMPPINPTTLSYSDNGEFMLANSVDYQTIINTNTNMARKFGFKTPSYSGSQPKVNTALSGSGALALINVSDGPISRLYNLNQCTGIADGSVIEACQMLDFFTAIKTSIPNAKSITRAKFIGESTLYFKAQVETQSGSINETWFKATIEDEGSRLDYLALGDSYASGEGAYNYKKGTNQPGNNCRISLDSYAYLIKTQMNFSHAESVACSGAKQKDARKYYEQEYRDDKPQSNGKDDKSYDAEIYSQFLPGYRWQSEFLRNYHPKAVTISIGGNDIGFGEKLKHCILSPYDCYSSSNERNSILTELKAQFPELVKTYNALKAASPETKIYVIGYPNIANPGGDCALNVRLSSEEMKLSESLVADLNYVIKAAAERAGVFYVDTTEAFHGARLCETSFNNTAVNGIVLGDDQGFSNFRFIGSESYHPNKLGHQRYASTIISATNGLTRAMPAADQTLSIDNMPSRLIAQPVGVNVALPIRILQNTSEFVKRGTSLILDVAVNSWLEPGANYRVEVHSDPLEIGSAVAKDQEVLSIDAVIPSDLSLGTHTIHIYGTNGLGEPVDFYKNIVVFADEDDVDGDGILNAEDNCPFMEPIYNEGSDFCSVNAARIQSAFSQMPAPLLSEATASSFFSRTPSYEINSLTPWLGVSPPEANNGSGPEDSVGTVMGVVSRGGDPDNNFSSQIFRVLRLKYLLLVIPILLLLLQRKFKKKGGPRFSRDLI